MSQPLWISLYLHAEESAETVKSALSDVLESVGGSAYDPFGLMPSRPYSRAVKLFIAPAGGGWIRLNCSPDVPLAQILPSLAFCIAAHIDGSLVPAISIYKNGVEQDVSTALAPYLADADAFSALLAAPKSGADTIGGVASSALPKNIRAMSTNLPAGQINRMVQSMSGGRMSKQERESAEASLKAVDWNSGAGSWIQALLGSIHPALTAVPDYATLSTAYRTARRLARNPNATLYAGDAEARAEAPDAEHHLPVFYGWKD